MRTALATLTTVFLSITAYTQPCFHAAREVAPILSSETRTLYEKNLEDAEAVHLEKPNAADSIIWLGRRMAYLGRYKDAVRVFSSGLVLHKTDARLYRHRGHRYITLRCFDDAIRDLEAAAKLVAGKADEIEPDGIPNSKNIPTSTLQSNIWYHLGLAHYLKGDYAKALGAYQEAQKVSKNNDMRVATSYWHHITLRRLGKKKEAKKILDLFKGKVELIENDEYLSLIRLNRGEIKPEVLLAQYDKSTGVTSATLGYGLGVYELNEGADERAWSMFSHVLRSDQWASFGYIASEQDIQRVRVAP